MGGHGQQHCLICGGPANWRQWQRNHVGITEDNVPIDLFDYEEECGTFQINTTHSQMNATLPARDAAFHVGGFGEIHDGLTCHASCYQLLYSRLGYTLMFEDVLPLLQSHRYAGGYKGMPLQLGTSSLLWSEYGRVENGLDQDCSYSDSELWMLEDPLQNKQNAKRILQIWQPLIESFRQSPADQLKPKLLALCGSFGMAARALEMQNADINSEQCLVHKAMAAMPTCIVHTIALKAGLIWDEPNAGDEQNMPHGHMMGEVHQLGVHLRNSTALAEVFHPMLQDLLHTGPYPSTAHFLQLAVEYAGCTHYPQFLDKYYPEHDHTHVEIPALIKDLLRQARAYFHKVVKASATSVIQAKAREVYLDPAASAGSFHLRDGISLTQDAWDANADHQFRDVGTGHCNSKAFQACLMAYYMWRQQLKQPVAISEASFTTGELSLVSVEVLRILHLTQAALQPGQQIIGNKLTADQFQSEYEALFREKGVVADFGFDPYIDPHHAPRTCYYHHRNGL